MAQPLKALAALPEELGSIPNTFMAHNHLTPVPGQSMLSSRFHRQQAQMEYTQICASETPKDIK